MLSLSMVQITTEKFTDQRLLSSRNVTTASDMHYPFSINRMSLTESPNESESTMKSTVSSVHPKEAQNNSDSPNLVGNKRQSECSSTPPPRHQSPATNGSTGHLVYVRRKLETEHGKANAASNGDTACSSGVRKSCTEASAKTETEQEQTVKAEEDQSKAAAEVPCHVESQKEISTYWTERFNCLQDLLQNLDKSGLKDYAEKFRNFSVEDLNKHAIELEKRAIFLSVEEVMQLKRVKELNLLGNSSQ